MAMLAYATARGVYGIQGVAETLPFKDGVFDFGLVVTTICFVDDVSTSGQVCFNAYINPVLPIVLYIVNKHFKRLSMLLLDVSLIRHSTYTF